MAIDSSFEHVEVEPRDVTRLVVWRVGWLQRCSSPPGVRVLDAIGEPVGPVDGFLLTLSAGDAPSTTLHSYASALLRWWRFLAAIDVDWDRVSRVEVRDFVLWLRLPTSSTLRHRGDVARGPSAGSGYAPATINHNLAVLRSFYDERLSAGQGPVINPVPTATGHGGQRLGAHHNPMLAFAPHRRAPLRQKTPTVAPRGLPDREFDALFAAMGCDRDRALLAFYVSTGARASELLGLTTDRVDVSGQLIGVLRKGTGRLQWLPASTDAFVWWRLYEQRVVRPAGQTAVWLTRRAPVRPLTYAAMRRVTQRANGGLGTGWTLHDLRHTAARRMIADPSVSLTDVQWVLGHAHLSTTAIYTRPDEDEVIARMLQHHHTRDQPPTAPPASAYRPEVLQALLGGVGHRH